MNSLQMRQMTNKNMSFFTMFVGALLFSFALSVNMNVPTEGPLPIGGGLGEICYNICMSFEGRERQASILFLGVFELRRHLQKNTGVNKGAAVFNTILALIWTCAEGFRIDNNVFVLMRTTGQRVKTVLYFLGCVYGLNLLFLLFSSILETESKQTNDVLPAYFKKHLPLCMASLLMLFWLPPVIAAYPASISYDAYSQFAQYFGLTELTTRHPVAHTFLMGSIVSLGSRINGNFGLFLFVLLQLLVFSLVQGYLFKLLSDFNAPLWLFLSVFGIGIVSPYYFAYIPTLLKDNLFSYFVLLLVIELAYFVDDGNRYFKSTRHILLYFISATGTWLFRNNGKYIITATSIAIVAHAVKTSGKDHFGSRKKTVSRCLLTVVLPIVVSLGINSYMTTKYEAEPGSIAEAFSLPFQQTARYVQIYKNEITEEEAAAIDAVLDYRGLAAKYDPRISDPVKRTYKRDSELSDLACYFRVWLRQFTKHPATYCSATLNQNYYLFYPFIANNMVYTRMGTSYKWQTDVLEKLNTAIEEQREQRGGTLESLYQTLFYLPFFGLMIHPATYTILSLWLVVSACNKKKKNYMLIALPSILSILIVVAAPAIQGIPRYAFPIIYAAPVLLSAYINLSRETNG